MSEASQPIPILVVSGEVEAGEAVKADLAVTTNGTHDIPFQERSLRVGMKLRNCPNRARNGSRRWSRPPALALLVRHVDVLSLDRIREIYTLMFEELGKPFSVMILRNEGESDFKMSCPHCGQKIWVRDSDVNKRGRCPNCKKGFNLPSQIRHLRTNLQLSEDVPVMMVVKGNAASAKIALITLAKNSAGRDDRRRGSLCAGRRVEQHGARRRPVTRPSRKLSARSEAAGGHRRLHIRPHHFLSGTLLGSKIGRRVGSQQLCRRDVSIT
jgi:predicted RNA-binding Zn-ribbon protein involved in translation (DUF1610 family)